MKKIIVICDSDSFYAIRLMEYIKRRELGFQVLVFTERDSFEEYIKDNHIEILLLGETLSLKGLKIR